MEDSIKAIGEQDRLTSGMREVYNGNSELFSSCPSPWDDEFLAVHGADTHGQTFDDWNEKRTNACLVVKPVRTYTYVL